MQRSIPLVSFLVRDYDEAIAFFRDTLGFVLVEDQEMGGGKRWVVMSPAGKAGASLLLARAATPEQAAAVGNQAGGRVFLFLHTGDFARDHERMLGLGVQFLEQPRQEAYGTVAVFRDLYGNKWDLIQPTGGITTRDALPGDAAALARLAGQLGYPVTPEQVRDRLARARDRRDERVVVAVSAAGDVIAWTTVRAVEHLHSEPHAEISGFVVEEVYRGRGVGRVLMSEVERWARERRLPSIRLSANVTRAGAHRFYQSLGFTMVKQQHAFRKELA